MQTIPCRDTCAYIVQDSFALNGNFRIRGYENIWTCEENYRNGSAKTYILYWMLLQWLNQGWQDMYKWPLCMP